MKNTFLALAIAMGVAGAAQAQGIKYGVKAGASLTNFTGKGGDGSEYKFGFNGGVLANFAFNDAFSIQPEVLYSMKGSKGTIDFFSSTITSTQTLHYIDVPVLAHINAGGLFFELGPQIGFLAAATGKADAGGGNSSSGNNKDFFNKVDFGYAAGLGYQVANGPGIGLRYNGGFTDIYKGNNGDYSTRNGAFQLYLSYMFGGK